ncbi:MAG: hypothetical protein WCE63_09530 [Acidobacteriaceae bacterium]
MALLSTQTQTEQRRVRGREKRNMTLNTKLTEAEFAAVEKYCEAHAIAFGEWVRELVLRELKEPAAEHGASPLMVEIQALRLVLINALEPLLRGEQWTADQFKEMLRYVKSNKQRVAAELMDTYRNSAGE